MTNVLITGGAGFIGSHTAEALVARGHSVRILDILDPQVHGRNADFPSALPAAVECLRGDVRNPTDVQQALANIDVVFHFAARTGVGQSMYDIRCYVDVNCTGTATLLECLLASQRTPKRLVLSSSRAVYGEGTHQCPTHGEIYPDARPRERLSEGKFEVLCQWCGVEARVVPTREDRPLKPVSIYGWTKKHQEDLCIQVAATYGMPTTILRYFNVYGSRQCLRNPYTGVVSIFYTLLKTGQRITCYEYGRPRRDFVHVSDVVAANLQAMEADIAPGTTINVGSGRGHTIRDIVDVLAKVAGRQPDVRDTQHFRLGDIHSCVADIERAKGLLRFEPKAELEAGIKEFVGWAATQEAENLYHQSVTELKEHGLFGGHGPGAA